MRGKWEAGKEESPSPAGNHTMPVPPSVSTPHHPSPRPPRGTSRAAEGEVPGLPYGLQDLGGAGCCSLREGLQSRRWNNVRRPDGLSLRDGQGQVRPKGGRTAGPPTPSPGQGFLPPHVVNEGVCDISSWQHIPVLHKS